MKKTLSKVFLTFLIFGLLTTSLWGGDPPVATLGVILNDDDGTEPIFTLNGCITRVTMQVLVANLEKYLPASSDDGEDYLPEGSPKMFVKYSVNGGPFAIEEVTTFYFNSVENGILTYLGRFKSYPVNLSTECGNTPPGEILPLDYTMELLMPDPNGVEGDYLPYPACNYSDWDEMFSCTVFYHARYVCGGNAPGIVQDDPNGTFIKDTYLDEEIDDNHSIVRTDTDGECYNDSLTNVAASLKIECGGCYSLQGGGNKNKEDNKSDHLINVSANPNPFDDKLEVQWAEEDGIESLTLVDMNGKLIRSWNQKQVNDLNSLNIDTRLLPKGLYLLKVKSTTSMKVIKTVKQ